MTPVVLGSNHHPWALTLCDREGGHCLRAGDKQIQILPLLCTSASSSLNWGEKEKAKLWTQ